MTGVMPTAGADQRRRQSTDDETLRAPVHPRWTHAPLGGLVLVAVFDVVSAVAGSTRPWARELYRSGTFALTALPVLVATAVGTGLIDRARGPVAHTPLRARVNLHAVVMVVMAIAAAVDLALRRVVYPDARHTPAAVLALTVVALVAAVVGGDLGGRLTYRAGIGVQAEHPLRSDAGGPP